MHRVLAAAGGLYFVVCPGSARSQAWPVTVRSVDPGLVDVRHVACGDIDLDGVPDVLLANGFGQAFGGPWRALRMGVDGVPVGVDVPPAPGGDPMLQHVALAALDADRDGLLDVVACDARGVVRLFGNGGPAQRRRAGQPFLAPVLLQDLGADLGLRGGYLVQVPWLVAGDLDGDGHDDFVFAAELAQGTGAPASLGLHLFLGDATGGFANRPVTSTPHGRAWAAVDFAGDGRAEFVVAWGTGMVDVYRQLGGGLALAARQTLGTALSPTAMASGDLDGDGVPELVLAGDPGVPQLQVVRCDRAGTFQAATPLAVPASAPAELPAVQVVDLDADGIADVVALRALGGSTPAQLLWWRGLGGGQLAAPLVTELPGALRFRFLGMVTPTPQPHLLQATDFDRDGVPDLVLAGLVDAAGAPRLATVRGAAPARCVASTLGLAATGGGGFAPRIGSCGGLPLRGNAEFGLTLRDAPGDGAVAVLVLGHSELALPLGEGLWCYTWPRVVDLRFTTGTGDGGGHAVVRIPIPTDPGLSGLSCRAQWVVEDRHAPRTLPFTTSDALWLVVGG